MFKVSKDEIEKLVDKEYEGAIEYGLKFNSEHEFYSVLLEELEEVKENFEDAEYQLNSLWENIKLNFEIKDDLKYLKLNLNSMIKEALQCLAVIKKYERGNEYE